MEGKILLPFHILKNSETGNRLLKDLYQIRTLFRKREAGDELLAKRQSFGFSTCFGGGEIHTDAGYIRNEKNLSKVKAALDYVHSRYWEDITLDDMAQAARMNRGQFCRIFRSLLRMILVQYLNGYRIRHSGRLLEETEKKSVM